jgi:hypothetical protein
MKRIILSLFFACISVIILSGFIFSPGWEVDPDSYYYGGVEYLDYKDKQFTVTGGYYHGGGGTVYITGQDASLFSCISGCSYYVDTDEEHVVTIRFTPPDCPREYNENLSNYSATIEFPEYSGVIEVPIAGSGTGEEPSWCPE